MGLTDRLFVSDRSSKDTRTELVKNAEKRAAMVPDNELPRWIDNAISETGRGVQAFLRDGDEAMLDEADLNASVLQELLRELRRRRLPS